MFSGTSTTLGIKLGFAAAGAPESITFGYKRKEVSIIPIGIMVDPDTKIEKIITPLCCETSSFTYCVCR